MMGLILRDFDEEQDQFCAGQPLEAQDSPPAEPTFSFTETELAKLLADARSEGMEKGEKAGFEAGRTAAFSETTAKTEVALAAVETELSTFIQQDAQRRAELEQDLVDMVLEICERLMPDFLKAYSAELAHARIAQAVHMGMENARLEIKLAPETEAALNQHLSQLDPAEDYLTIRKDSSLQPGQTLISWKNGFMEYNLEQVCAELLKALNEASEQMKQQRQKV